MYIQNKIKHRINKIKQNMKHKTKQNKTKNKQKHETSKQNKKHETKSKTKQKHTRQNKAKQSGGLGGSCSPSYYGCYTPASIGATSKRLDVGPYLSVQIFQCQSTSCLPWWLASYNAYSWWVHHGPWWRQRDCIYRLHLEMDEAQRRDGGNCPTSHNEFGFEAQRNCS